MARQFIYDNIGFSEATVEDGTVTATTFNPAPASVTNEERANDMSISTAFTSFGLNDALRFDVGSANASTNANAIALYYTADHGHDMRIYKSSSATAMGTHIAEKTDNFVEGWNIITFSATAARYWFVHSTAGTIDDITEIIIGTKYDFDINPELNAVIGEEFGTDIITSYGGNEYANKRHSPKTTWSFNFEYLPAAQKTAFEALNSNVQDWKKFVYYDDTNYHYVRLTDPIEFTEVAPSIFSCGVNLREQLA